MKVNLERRLREIEAQTCSVCGGTITGSYIGSGKCENCTVDGCVRWKASGKNLSRPHLVIADTTK